jgi:tetratricopeptide (TPR) repeat protein
MTLSLLWGCLCSTDQLNYWRDDFLQITKLNYLIEITLQFVRHVPIAKNEQRKSTATSNAYKNLTNLFLTEYDAVQHQKEFTPMFRPCLLLNAIFISVCLYPAVSHSGNSETTTAAKEAFAEGGELFTQGKYSAAAEAFRRAYALSPTWKLLYNIAQAETAAKHYGVAIGIFEQYLAEGGDELPESRSDAVQKEIQRLRLLVGTVEVVAPAGAIFYVDDVQRGTLPFSGPMRLSIGKHQVRLELNHETLLNREISIAGGMPTYVKVTSEDEVTGPVQPNGDSGDEATAAASAASTSEPEPSAASNESGTARSGKGLLIGGLSSSAVSLAGLVVGIVFNAKLSDDLSKRDAAKAKYLKSGSVTDYNLVNTYQDDAVTDSNVTKVGFIAGGVLAVTGAILLTVHWKKMKRNHPVAVSPGGLRISF